MTEDDHKQFHLKSLELRGRCRLGVLQVAIRTVHHLVAEIGLT
jgi:hypothetical protein